MRGFTSAAEDDRNITHPAGPTWVCSAVKALSLVTLAIGLAAGPGGVLRAQEAKAGAEEPTPGTGHERICLNGQWLVHLGGDEWQIPAQGYRLARVPGKIGGDWYEEFTGNENGHECGWYRLDFLVPPAWEGKRIYIDFVRVGSYAKVFLDGRLVGDHPDGNTPFSVDLTGRAVPGSKHRLHVFVQGWSRFRKSRHQGVWPIGFNRQVGITGDVYLRCTSPVHIADVFVITSVRQRVLSVRVTLSNTTPQAYQLRLKGSVRLGPTPVLDLPEVPIQLSAGESKEVEVQQHWEAPQLWGYPPYGEPVLYHLYCVLKDEAGEMLDQRFTRFGFREFWIEGDKFLLNGRPIFLQGEQAQFSSMVMYAQNRQWILQYFRALREANVNFVRLPHGFFWPILAEVADEVGMLLENEPMDGVPTAGYASDSASGAAVLAEKAEAQWLDDRSRRAHLQTVADWVREWRNHPSLVMWSTDNESSSQSALANPATFAIQKQIKDLILSLDPTRPVAHEGSPLTSAARRLGVDLVPDVYNIHPYSDPITQDVEENKRRHFYSGQPVVIGELFNDYPKINFSPEQLSQEPADKWAKAQSFADYWYRNIVAAKEAGYAGTVLLCLASSGFYGYVREGEFTLGPLGRETRSVPVTWPSLSGPGPKVENYLTCIPWDTLNWFDSSKPVYVPTHVFQRVKEAYALINGGDLPPLPATRRPELVVTLTYRNQPVPGAYLYLRPLDGQPEDCTGVLTDHEGTAWFCPDTAGHYRLECQTEAGPQHIEVTLQRGPFDGQAGYHHIQRLTMNLLEPPQETVRNLPDTAPSAEPDVVWTCLPQEQLPPEAITTPEAPGYINLEKIFNEDGKPTPGAREHDLRLYFHDQELEVAPPLWSGSIKSYPGHTKVTGFSLLLPAPKPGTYELILHKPHLSPERSAELFVGEEQEPRLILNTNAADLGLEFAVAGRDARYTLEIKPENIHEGRVRLRFNSTSWSAASIGGISLRPK